MRLSHFTCYAVLMAAVKEHAKGGAHTPAPETGPEVSHAPAEKTGTTNLATMDYGDLAGAGFQNQTQEDIGIPFLGILQGLSPQMETVEGAKLGKLINTITNDLYDGKTGVGFVPAVTQHVYVEWVPRDNGGGFVGLHELDSEVVTKARAEGGRFGKITLPNGNELLETFYVYGLLVRPDGAVEQSVIAFTSTKIKAYRGWMAKARLVQIVVPGKKPQNPPLFAHRFRLTTVKEKNKEGEYYNFSVAWDGADALAARLAPSDPLFQEAYQMMKSVSSGSTKAAHDKQGQAEEEDIPF